jgi:nucleotide-binding universal stress UspA family protein
MSHGSILVGVDGSKPSVRALDWATQQAHVMDAHITLICAYGSSAYASAGLNGGLIGVNSGNLRAAAELVIAQSLDRCAVARVEATGYAIGADVLAVLVDQSAAMDLVVIGTRSAGSLMQRSLGRVSTALPAHARCPTVVVPYKTLGSGATDRGTETGAGPLDPVRRIVVGVDGSEESFLALREAVNQAQLWGAELTVLSAISGGSTVDLLSWLPAPGPDQDVIADVQRALGPIVAEYAADLTTPVYTCAEAGSAAGVLEKASTMADLLVVGSRGRGRFTGLILGSTSQAILHNAHCPVLIVTARSAGSGKSGQ